MFDMYLRDPKRGMKSKPKTHRVEIRVSDEEFECWTLWCQHLGISLSQFVRESANMKSWGRRDLPEEWTRESIERKINEKRR